MRAPVVTRPALWLLLVVVLPAQGCVLEWVDYVTKLVGFATASDEFRVRDLRVLAMETEVGALRYPLAFLDEHADAEPITLRARVFAYDPRGGDVETSFSLCARSFDAASLGALVEAIGDESCVDAGEVLSTDADVARSLQPVQRTVTAGPASSGGRLPDLDYELRFDGEALRALLQLVGGETPEYDPALVGRFQLLLVQRVSRVWLGTPEDEWAVLPLEARPALLDATPDELAAFLEAHDAELCEPNEPRDCLDPRFDFDPGGLDLPETGESVCGDGVLQGTEECDPPDGSWCADDCTIIVCETICTHDGPPMVSGLLGIDRVDVTAFDARESELDDAELHDGDTVTLRPGDELSLQVVVKRVGEQEGFPGFVESRFRWYLFGDGDILAPRDELGNVYQGFSGGIRYGSSADTHAPGDRELLVLVAGGEAQEVLTLELVFE